MDTRKDDARLTASESKRRFAEALVRLMEEKPLDQVRVSEICTAAGVSKQTFYHHFTDKYDLMAFCFRGMFAEPLDHLGSVYPFEQAYREFLALCHERKTFLRNGFYSHDVNSLYRALHHVLRDAYGSRVRAFGDKDEGDLGFCLDFFSKGCAGCTRHWFDMGMDFTDEEIAHLIHLSVPVGAKRFFE